MDMAEKIREKRKEHGLTLEEVGNLVGVGKSTVRKWETGDIANMRRDKIAKLAAALHTTPAYLMGWEEEPTAQLDSEPANNFTEEDIQLLEALKALSPRDKSALLAQIAALNALRDQESKPSPNQKGHE